MKTLKKSSKRTTKLTLILFLTLIMIYICFFIFFQTHFYFGTVINGINASCKTIKYVDGELATKAEKYTLELNERGNKVEQIKGSEIGLKYDLKGGSQSLKEEQNKYSWFIAIFNHKAINIKNVFTWDESLLKSYFSKLNCVDDKNTIEPKNASLVYSSEGYKIVKEIEGNKIDKDILYSSIKKAVTEGKEKLDLEAGKCYINPTIKADSQLVKDTQNTLNKYITSKITYSYVDGSEVVDVSEIKSWIQIDSNLGIAFNNEMMRSFLNKLATHYNTYGKTRDFITSLGTTIKVGGGDYGWRVDITSELKYLTEAIKNGQVINSREPQYIQKAASHDANDIGNTYVEINFPKQHMWYYKNGKLIVEGDVVTGNVSKGNGTPSGIYRIKYKEKNAVLQGEDYRTPVSYWMPFNGNIGIHDATWRAQFGGDIYLTDGSHGCINSPYPVAQAIYENISAGVPVVCYY